MQLITIMDYEDQNSITMCKSWIYLAKRYNPDSKICIFYYRDISTIRQFSSRYRNVSFIKLRFPSSLYQISRGHTHHPAQELQLTLWKQLESLHITKYIYIDADAFILSSLEAWWNVIDQQPYIAISETRRRSGELRLNAGVYSYSSKTSFITYNKLIKQYHDDGGILIEAGAQGLTDAYLRKIKYQYMHHNIGHEYNSLAKYCNIIRADDKNIVAYSGRYPFVKRALRMIFLRKRGFTEQWLWWGKPVRVKILHAFGGPGFKFWELPECRLLWNYCVSKTTT
jgi:hypothetical protein